MMIVRTMLALVAALACASTACAQARWPDRPIRLIVPFQAGSSSDTIARIVSPKLSERLGQQIVIENKVGGASIVGTDAVARAEPDGYTLGLANTTTHAGTSGLGGSVPFDPIKDFAPVAMIGYSPFVLLVTPGLPVNSVQDLVALAKAKPGVLNYASAGPGSLTHLAGALFEKMAGIQMTHVPYRGTGQSVIDVMEGRIEMVFGTIAPSLPHIRAGKLHALATTGYEAGLWTALVFPAGVSPAIITRLNAETNAVVNDPEVVAALKKQGVEIDTGTPEALAARIMADVVKWRDVISKAGIQ